MNSVIEQRVPYVFTGMYRTVDHLMVCWTRYNKYTGHKVVAMAVYNNNKVQPTTMKLMTIVLVTFLHYGAE